MTAICSDTTPTIAIIGGGCSGALTAAQLLRSPAPFPIAVQLIERTAAVGPGLAYGAADDRHLLNVPAGKMSALPDEPGHFLRWLETHYGQRYGADSFVPRQVYGAYLQALLRQAERRAAPGWRLETVHAEAVALTPRGDGARLRLRNGRTLSAARVVLAVGNFPPREPPVVDDAFYRDPRYSGDPWTAPVAAIDPDEDILLIGAGLTALDLVSTLLGRGHRGALHLLSRHGLLPQRHQACAPYPGFLTLADVAGLRVLARRVRREIAAAARQGHDWRAVIDALRPHTPLLWRALSGAERRRFLRHLKPYWEIHRHRIAPSVADAVEQWRRSGRLRLHAGWIQAYDERPDGVVVTYRPRHGADPRALRVARVINCAGPEGDYRRLRQPLLERLLEAGLIRPDPLALGLDVGADGALIGATGAPSRWLYTLGPPQKGCLWETTAVPEIREQARALAQVLLRSLRRAAVVSS